MKTLAKVSQADRVRIQAERNAELIQVMLDMDAELYAQFKFDTGLRYAEIMTNKDKTGLNILVQTKFYWAWWNNQWAKRDAYFLEHYFPVISADDYHDQYLYIHSIEKLIGDELMQKKAKCMVGYAADELVKGEVKC